MEQVIKWLKERNLQGLSRFYGGNVKPFPTDCDSEYGYGMCASIPTDIVIPSYLKEMVIL